MLKNKAKKIDRSPLEQIRPRLGYHNLENFDADIFLKIIDGISINDISEDRCLSPGTISTRMSSCLYILTAMVNMKMDPLKLKEPEKHKEYWLNLYHQYRFLKMIRNPAHIEQMFFTHFQKLSRENKFRVIDELNKLMILTLKQPT